MAFNKKKGCLSMNTNTPDLALKFYLEQIESIEKLKENIKNLDCAEYMCAAILHDKDINTDDFWEPAKIKPHIHLLIWRADGSRRKVSTYLNLLGVNYRRGLDDSIIKNHGVERIACLSSSLLYLTHETEEAEKDCKYQYDREDIITNLSIGMLDSLRAGYKGVKERRLTGKDKDKLYNLAIEAGKNLYSFDLVLDSMDSSTKLNKNLCSALKGYYLDSIKKAVHDKEIHRICIFVKGSPGIGKSKGVRNALKSLGVPLSSSLTITESAGTGAYDDLTPQIDTLFLDDYVEKNLLSMAEEMCCSTYRRNANNNPWCGRYLIITSNLDPLDYFKKCDYEHVEALCSRFHIVEIDDSPVEFENYDFQLTPKNRGVEDRKDFNSFVVPFVYALKDSMNTLKKLKKVPAVEVGGVYRDDFPLKMS